MAIRYLVHSEPDIDEVVLAINLGNDRHVILCAPPLSFRCPRGTAGHDHLESELCEEPVEEPVELETPSSHAPFYNFPIKIFSAIRTSLYQIFVSLPLQSDHGGQRLYFVDFDFIPLGPQSCPNALPFLPNLQLPKQNKAESGTTVARSTEPSL